MYTLIVTNMDSSPEFDFTAISSSSKIVNANSVQVHSQAYNIFNWFRRLVLSVTMHKQLVDTTHLKLIASKVVYSARYIIFKLYSSCPYKNEIYKTLENMSRLQPQLEEQKQVNLENENATFLDLEGFYT